MTRILLSRVVETTTRIDPSFIRFANLQNPLFSVTQVRLKIKRPIRNQLLSFMSPNFMPSKMANIQFIPVKLHFIASRNKSPNDLNGKEHEATKIQQAIATSQNWISCSSIMNSFHDYIYNVATMQVPPTAL